LLALPQSQLSSLPAAAAECCTVVHHQLLLLLLLVLPHPKQEAPCH